MTDLDRQFADSLNRLVGRATPVRPDWPDVNRRAASARRRTTVLLLAAAATLLVAVSTAFAVGPELWRLVTGTPVGTGRLSPEEKRLLASMSSGRPVLRTNPADPVLWRLGRLVSVRLLANRGGYTFYVIELRGRRHEACLATGRVGQEELFWDLVCPKPKDFPSPRRPVFDLSVVEMSHDKPEPRIFRLQGFAADGVERVGILDAAGEVVGTVPVVKNTYIRSTGLPSGPVKAVVAYDGEGRRVFCRDDLNDLEDPCGNGTMPPPPTEPPPPPPRIHPPPLREHIQRGTGDGVSVDVYQPGSAIFDLRSLAPRARRLLNDARIEPTCLRTRFYQGRWLADAHGSESAIRRRIRLDFVGEAYATDPLGELPPPYDACEIGGLRGHRWNDALGNHAPVEVPLTRRGRVFFEERAAARDLAYFVRGDRVQKVRRSDSPLPALQALARRHPGRVVQLAAASALPPKGAVGFWVGARSLVFSESTPGGRRLFVVAKRGTLKLPSHNLGDLAFVF